MSDHFDGDESVGEEAFTAAAHDDAAAVAGSWAEVGELSGLDAVECGTELGGQFLFIGDIGDRDMLHIIVDGI